MRFTAAARSTALGCVALAGSLVCAVTIPDYDPINDFCQRFTAQSAVMSNRLYIDGGRVTISNQGVDGQNFTNKHLLFHDLTSTSRDGQELTLPILETNLSKPSTVPSVMAGYLWPDGPNGKLYMYGGEYWESSPEAFGMWMYDEYDNTWSVIDTGSSINRLSFGAGTTVEYRGLGYYLGGYLNAQNTPNWSGQRHAVNTLLQYDYVNNRVFNQTSPSDGLGRAEGALFTVPVGDGGLLVAFGGSIFEDGDISKEQPSPMNEIVIYDIINNKWYKQNATGDIPPNRRRFCGGLVTAEDRSSHEIYIYGGLGYNETGFDDLWVLSLPSFTWTLLQSTNATTGYPKYDMTCNVVNNGSQMAIIGGQYAEADQKNTCDVPGGAGAHNLNLGKDDSNNAYWVGFNKTLFGYSIPDNVTEVIGGTATGGATLTSPALGWAHNDLQVQFSRTFTPPARQPTRAIPPEFGGPSSGKSKTKTIVAAVVPSVVGAGLIVGAAVFWWRRRRTKKTPGKASYVPQTPDGQSSLAQQPGGQYQAIQQSVGSQYGPGSPSFAPGSPPYGTAPPSYYPPDQPLPATLVNPENGQVFFTQGLYGPQYGYLPEHRTEAFELPHEGSAIAEVDATQREMAEVGRKDSPVASGSGVPENVHEMDSSEIEMREVGRENQSRPS